MTILSTGSVADLTDRCGRLTRVTGPDEGDDGPEQHHRLPVDPDVEADEDAVAHRQKSAATAV